MSRYVQHNVMDGSTKFKESEMEEYRKMKDEGERDRESKRWFSAAINNCIHVKIRLLSIGFGNLRGK